MQPATSEGWFSCRAFWRMVDGEQTAVSVRAPSGLWVSSPQGDRGDRALRLSSTSPGLLGWALALPELSLMPSWRNLGFPCGWADGTPPALAWGGLHMALMRCWWSPSTTSSLGANASACICFVFFQLPPSQICVLSFLSNLHFPITNRGGKEVNEARHQQICKGENVFLF